MGRLSLFMRLGKPIEEDIEDQWNTPTGGCGGEGIAMLHVLASGLMGSVYI